MKTSSIILNLARAAFVVLAYRELAQPKGTLIAPGTGRWLAHYARSCFHISRGYLKTILKPSLNSTRDKKDDVPASE